MQVQDSTGSTPGSEWEMCTFRPPSPCSRLGLVGPPGAGVTAADETGLAVNVVVPVAVRRESAVISISLRQEALCLPCPAVPAAVIITCSRTQLVRALLGLVAGRWRVESKAW